MNPSIQPFRQPFNLSIQDPWIVQDDDLQKLQQLSSELEDTDRELIYYRPYVDAADPWLEDLNNFREALIEVLTDRLRAYTSKTAAIPAPIEILSWCTTLNWQLNKIQVLPAAPISVYPIATILPVCSADSVPTPAAILAPQPILAPAPAPTPAPAPSVSATVSPPLAALHVVVPILAANKATKPSAPTTISAATTPAAIFVPANFVAVSAPTPTPALAPDRSFIPAVSTVKWGEIYTPPPPTSRYGTAHALCLELIAKLQAAIDTPTPPPADAAC